MDKITLYGGFTVIWKLVPSVVHHLEDCYNARILDISPATVEDIEVAGSPIHSVATRLADMDVYKTVTFAYEVDATYIKGEVESLIDNSIV